MNTGAEDDSLSTPTLAFSKSSARTFPPAASMSQPASASRKHPLIQFPPYLLSRTVRSNEALRQCLGNGGELPLPLWERVGVRGYGLSIEQDPSPGSHLPMRRSRSSASAFFFKD